MIFGKNIHGLLLHHQTGKLKTTRPYIGKKAKANGEKIWQAIVISKAS